MMLILNITETSPDDMGNTNIGAVRVYHNSSLLNVNEYDDNLSIVYPNHVEKLNFSKN